jgi:calcium/calmodulin-dependent protein kinase I
MSTLVGVDGLVRGRCGSPGYVAPEILKAEAGQGYRNQVDMFSAGVTLYLMLCGYEPFYGESEKELIKANKKAHIDFPDSEWSKISPEAKNLVVQMLKKDPSERITAEEAVEHPWIVRLAGDQKRYSSRHPESINDTFRNSELEGGVCAIM